MHLLSACTYHLHLEIGWLIFFALHAKVCPVAEVKLIWKLEAITPSYYNIEMQKKIKCSDISIDFGTFKTLMSGYPTIPYSGHLL